MNNRAIAAGVLLYTLGVTTAPNTAYREHRAFMDAIESEDAADRRQALDQLAA